MGHDLLYCPHSDVSGEPRRKLGHDLLYCPDPDVLGEPRTERKWVKGGEIQGAVLNLDDHMGWGAGCQVTTCCRPKLCRSGRGRLRGCEHLVRWGRQVKVLTVLEE